jgi:hypothetical protein
VPTHNIANGGESSKFEHCSPHRAFVSGDKNALRKPPLAILSTLCAIYTQLESYLLHHKRKIIMRNLMLICLMLFVGFSSCKKIYENCNPETIKTKFTLGKEIDVNYSSEFKRNDYSIKDGENILFEYIHIGAECEDRYDDEWGENLTFIVNKDTTDFEIKNGDIENLKCFYQEYGAWVRHNQYQIKDGIIKGKKRLDNTWEISVSVLTTPLFDDVQPKKIEFTGTFNK